MGIIMPEDELPEIERVDYSPVIVEYRTFEGTVCPNIVVYYLFSNGRNMGLAREYHCDLDGFVRGKCERIAPYGEIKHFSGERKFLDELIETHLQGLYVNVVHGMSFAQLASVASQVHARQVFDKYALLREIGVEEIKSLLNLVDAPRDSFFDELFHGGVDLGGNGRDDGYDGFLNPDDLWGEQEDS